MKKKIFSLVLLFVFLIPCFTLLTACGNLKSLNGKTLVFAKVEVDGTISKEDYENEYKLHSFVFDESEVTFSDGTNEDSYNYKVEKTKVYLKATTDTEYPSEAYAEIDGKYMVISQTVEGGVVKVYFKSK